jgi:hypothetical protein
MARNTKMENSVSNRVPKTLQTLHANLVTGSQLLTSHMEFHLENV